MQRQGAQKYYWRGSFNPRQIQRDNGTGELSRPPSPPCQRLRGLWEIVLSAELRGIGSSTRLTMRFSLEFISLELVKADAVVPWVLCLNLSQVSDEHKFFLLGDVQ